MWKHKLGPTYWTIISACQRGNWLQEQKINLCKQYVETCPLRHLFVYLSYGRRFLDTRKDIENTPDSRECAWDELNSAHACMRAVSVCIVCVCVCSLTLWCQPLRTLPALARHDPSVTFFLPSLLPSLPHPPHSVHPSLCVSILLFHPPVSLFTSILPSPSLFSYFVGPLWKLLCFSPQKFLFSVCSSLLRCFSSTTLSLLSSSALECLHRLKLIRKKNKTCGHSSLCSNNNSNHQKITQPSLRAFFHCSPR